MSPWTSYWLWVAALAVALFFPVSKLVWALSVRRLERRLGQPLSDQDRIGQLNRARFVAILVSIAFSALFNYHVLDMSSHG
jgi:hypothetical protein